MKKHSLNAELLPEISAMSIFSGLDSDVNKEMEEHVLFDESLDRARGAVMHFCAVDGESKNWSNESRLRAGFGEVCSMGEALRRDIKARGLRTQAHTLTRSRNPLLHLMYLLRNINFHVDRSRVGVHATSVIFEGERHSYKAIVVLNLELEQLLRRREVSRDYIRAEMASTIRWFQEKQCVFGAGHLFSKGVELYCRELLEVHKDVAS